MIAAPTSPIPGAQHLGADAAIRPDVAPVHIATIARREGETGIQTHSRTLQNGLAASGIACTLHTPFDAGYQWFPLFALRSLLLERLNRTWATLWHRHWHRIALCSDLVRSLRTQSPAIIVAQCPVSARAALDARSKLHGQFPIALICHFNSSEATEYRDKGALADPVAFERILKTEKQVLETVDQVIYVSHWARRAVEQERGIRPRSSAVIWNGIDRTPPQSNLSRRDLGLAADDLVLVNVGTLEPRKNQLALLEIFARAAANHPAARLVLIGEGPDRRAIEDRIAELNLGSRVRMLGFRRDVPDILGLSDIYVHTALLENCPMSLLEAAQAGLPIAASPAGGVAELLEALNGIPLTPSDPAASADALRPLLADPAIRADAGKRARQAFERHFTREVMLAGYIRALRLTPGVPEARS